MRSTKALCDILPAQTPPRPSLDLMVSLGGEGAPGVQEGLRVTGVPDAFGRSCWMAPVAMKQKRVRLYNVEVRAEGKSSRFYAVPSSALLPVETSTGWALAPVAEASKKSAIVPAASCLPRSGGYRLGSRGLRLDRRRGWITGVLFGSMRTHAGGKYGRISSCSWGKLEAVTDLVELTDILWRLTACVPRLKEEPTGALLVQFPSLSTGVVQWFLSRDIDPNLFGCNLEFAAGFVHGFFSTGSVDRRGRSVWRKTTRGHGQFNVYRLLQCMGEGLYTGLCSWRGRGWGALSIADGGQLPDSFMARASIPLRSDGKVKKVAIREVCVGGVVNAVTVSTKAFTVLGSGLAVRYC